MTIGSAEEREAIKIYAPERAIQKFLTVKDSAHYH